jgi:hypothetical protein
MFVAGMMMLAVAVMADTPAATTPTTPPPVHRSFAGTVVSVDATNQVIVVQVKDGTQVQVAVATDTQIFTQTKAAATDLQLGQTVALLGHATALTTDETDMTALPAAAAGTPAPAATTPATPHASKSAGRVRISGQVTNLNPLTVTTPDGTPVAITMSPNATFTLTTVLALTDVQPGQRLEIQGLQPAAGDFQARTVRVLEAPVKPAPAGGPAQ